MLLGWHAVTMFWNRFGKPGVWRKRLNSGVFFSWYPSFQSLISPAFSGTHRLVFLLRALKGKRLLFKLIGNDDGDARWFDLHRQRVFGILLVANFDQLDVVRDAHFLDSRIDSPEREEVERQTATFITAWNHFIDVVVTSFDLKMLAGYLSELMKRNNMVQVLQSRVRTHSLFFLLESHDVRDRSA